MQENAYTESRHGSSFESVFLTINQDKTLLKPYSVDVPQKSRHVKSESG